MTPVVSLVGALRPALPRLSKLFDLLQAPTATLGRYGCDIQGFAANWRSFMGDAPKNQSGPLGPQTILRLEDAGAGLQLPGSGLVTLGSQQTPNPSPCAQLGASQ